MGGTSMTTDVEVTTSTALHAALVEAAGPERTLTLMALRELLVGADKTALVEALSQIVREGITLPPTVAATFGLRANPLLPSEPQRPTPAHTRGETSDRTRLPAVPTQKAPGPRFTIELSPDSRLDLTALTIGALLPNPVPAQPPARAEQPFAPSAEPTPAAFPAAKSPARTASDAADAAFEDSSPRQPVFNSLKYYRKVIGKYPLLSQRQEAELAQAIEAGLLAREKLDEAGRTITPKLRRKLEQLATLGEQAFTQFAHSNLRLVVSVATRYTGRGLDLMDLIQEGNAGMLHAIEMFDHRKGFKFSTYAVNWIRQAVQRALADQSRTVRLPVHAHDTLAALRKSARELGHGAPADDLSSVADRTGVPTEKAAELLSQVRRTVPLEDLAEAIGDDALHEEMDRSIQGPYWIEPDAYYWDMSPQEVHTLLDCLSQRERRVITLRHGLDGGPELTLDAIGWDLGVTRERVRQIESKVMSKLRGRIHEIRIRAARPIVAPLSTTQPGSGSRPLSGNPSEVPRVRRKVYPPGYIVVGHQTIHVGTQLCGQIVTVLLEDDWFRLLHEGRQIATATRRYLNGHGKIYGAPN
jgi:RNA polymerase primary sigma factor